MSASCGACGADVEWAVTEAGALVALDPAPVRDDGTVVLTGYFRQVLGGPWFPEARLLGARRMTLFGVVEADGMVLGAPTYRRHDETCPAREEVAAR